MCIAMQSHRFPNVVQVLFICCDELHADQLDQIVVVACAVDKGEPSSCGTSVRLCSSVPLKCGCNNLPI